MWMYQDVFQKYSFNVVDSDRVVCMYKDTYLM